MLRPPARAQDSEALLELLAARFDLYERAADAAADAAPDAAPWQQLRSSVAAASAKASGGMRVCAVCGICVFGMNVLLFCAYSTSVCV